MTQRTFALTILLIVVVLGQQLPWTSALSFMQRAEQLIAEPFDAESLLASGRPLPLICADISSLELIPGISDKTAVEILDHRQVIMSASRSTPLHESLKLARGIGDKTASRIARYLTESGGCGGAKQYSIFKSEIRRRTNSPNSPIY